MAQGAVATRMETVSAVLPPEFSAVQVARELVHSALAGWQSDALADDVALVASELVANALVHGLRLPASAAVGSGDPSERPGRVELKLESTGSHLICTVHDPNPIPPVRRPMDEAALGGRGLQLIESLSMAWGWTPIHDAKCVWAIFPLAEADALSARCAS